MRDKFIERKEILKAKRNPRQIMVTTEIKKEGSEEIVDTVVAEVASREEEVLSQTHPTEIVDPISTRRLMTIRNKRRIRVMIKSKETEKAMEDKK